MKQAIDSNSKPVPALRPAAATDVTSTTQAITEDGVVRLVAAADASYGINVAASVDLPAGVVEYIRVAKGDTLYVFGTINVCVCT